MKKYDFFRNAGNEYGRTGSLRQAFFFVIFPVILIYSLIWDKYFDDIFMISPVLIISVIFFFRRNRTYSLIFSFLASMLVPIIRIQSMTVCPLLLVILYMILIFFSIFDMEIILYPAFCIAFQIISLYFFKVEISTASLIPAFIFIIIFFVRKFFYR